MSDTKQAAHRLTWLCNELYHGNQFSKADLWKWGQEARAALERAGESPTGFSLCLNETR